jgi:hypothetical protein
MKQDDMHIRKINDDEMQLSGASEEFVLSVEKGVTDDVLDIKMITFWSVITILFMIAMAYSGYRIYKFYGFQNRAEQAISTEYKELQQKRATDAQHLSSYGMVDGEAGVYRIPIDTAIDLYVTEQKGGN